ncbi:hypothetical protein F2P81_008192 [Scophthalmus maximus]|uniref:Uncharacterized protein n=1 Tax=Scophthalmus maximus TaxID=52904 RepID=A0A6A4T1M1_SCOMX|nr:hypothetical protein F2P81_008192 [Scophthalmus maximus]
MHAFHRKELACRENVAFAVLRTLPLRGPQHRVQCVHEHEALTGLLLLDRRAPSAGDAEDLLWKDEMFSAHYGEVGVRLQLQPLAHEDILDVYRTTRFNYIIVANVDCASFCGDSLEL